MRCLIICSSIHHGNTEKIGRAIQKVLEADWKTPREVTGEDWLNYDLFGFGSGVYHGEFHAGLLTLVNLAENVSGKKAFIFATSGMQETNGFNSFGKKFKTLLISKGFEILGGYWSPGWDTYSIFKWIGGLNKGRPNESDIFKARKFARKLRIKKIKSVKVKRGRLQF